MPATIEIEIKGLEELQARLNAGENAIMPELYRGMNKATQLVKRDAEKYPPLSEANAPPPPFYIRGVGTQYRNGRNRGESQHMNDNWYAQVQLAGKDVSGIVVNALTTYAPWLHGLTRQLDLSRARGWRNVTVIAESNAKRVTDIFDDIARRIARIMGGK